MNTKIKRIGKRLLFPAKWVIFLLIVCSAVGLTLIFHNGAETSPLAPIGYVFAAYTLTVVCCFLAKTLPPAVRKTKQQLHNKPVIHRYLTDPNVKASVHLCISLGMNVVYVAINIASAVIYHTNWFGIFAVYYTLLAFMRILLIPVMNPAKTTEKEQLKRVRLCACLLATINLALSAAVLMMVTFRRGFSYNGLLIYAMATYTFYSIGSAIASAVRAKQYNAPAISFSTAIKLTAALVSMLTLETAMFTQFGNDMPLKDQQIMIMVTGGEISVIIITMALLSIIRTTKKLKKTE